MELEEPFRDCHMCTEEPTGCSPLTPAAYSGEASTVLQTI